MNILEIKNIERKDVPIYYRRIYTAVAVLEFMESVRELRLEFSIETKPTGAKDYSVQLTDPVEYPVLPIIKAVREQVTQLDKTGGLPW